MKEMCQEVVKRCLGMHVRKAARLSAVYYDDHLRPADMYIRARAGHCW